MDPKALLGVNLRVRNLLFPGLDLSIGLHGLLGQDNRATGYRFGGVPLANRAQEPAVRLSYDGSL